MLSLDPLDELFKEIHRAPVYERTVPNIISLYCGKRKGGARLLEAVVWRADRTFRASGGQAATWEAYNNTYGKLQRIRLRNGVHSCPPSPLSRSLLFSLQRLVVLFGIFPVGHRSGSALSSYLPGNCLVQTASSVHLQNRCTLVSRDKQQEAIANLIYWGFEELTVTL